MHWPALARRPIRAFVTKVLLLVLAAAAPTTVAAGPEFPFGQELLLDVEPMPGSKRVPSLEIAANGSTVIELWCNRVQGQIVVVENTISILSGPATERQCTPERIRSDEAMLTALTQVTGWKRDGDIVILEGAKPLRFRISTN